MNDLQQILAQKNVMPWFHGGAVLTSFDHAFWDSAAQAIVYPKEIAGDPSSFCILIPPANIVGVGELGEQYPQVQGFVYLPLPWSKRMLILTPDVPVLIRVSDKKKPQLREIVRVWLEEQGVGTTYDPSTNDMLINNKKFLGVQTYEAPLGYRCEFGMMTLHKDEQVFNTALPTIFQTNARGYKLAGLLDEVDRSITEMIPQLYAVEKGE